MMSVYNCVLSRDPSHPSCANRTGTENCSEHEPCTVFVYGAIDILEIINSQFTKGQQNVDCCPLTRNTVYAVPIPMVLPHMVELCDAISLLY